jgi:hypothetical protein
MYFAPCLTTPHRSESVTSIIKRRRQDFADKCAFNVLVKANSSYNLLIEYRASDMMIGQGQVQVQDTPRQLSLSTQSK